MVDLTGQTTTLVEVEGIPIAEVWRDVAILEVEGFYQISNYGRVKSKARYDTRGRFRKEKLLLWRENGGRNSNKPYYHVCLCHGNYQKNFKIHQLVAKAFVSGYFDKATVNHEDGNKGNNFFMNLSWTTLKENCQHRNDTGLLKNVTGLAHGRQVLTEEDVTQMYVEHMKGKPREAFNAAELGRQYGVHGRAILNIYRKEAWKWLTDELD